MQEGPYCGAVVLMPLSSAICYTEYFFKKSLIINIVY